MAAQDYSLSGDQIEHPVVAVNRLDPEQLSREPELLENAFIASRAHTLALTAPLSAEDMLIQSMPDASPTKWHLAHTSWFYETFVLARFEPGLESGLESGFDWFDESYCVLFNSYYNGVGAQFARPRRGMISRPSLAGVMAYRKNVEQRVVQLIRKIRDIQEPQALAAMVQLGINHEQQHQELLITDIKHALAQTPAWPAYGAPAGKPVGASDRKAASCASESIEDTNWLTFSAQSFQLGFAGKGFSFDNETPRHRTLVPEFALADRPANNAQWLAFINDGGYDNPLLWLSEGWAWRTEHGVTHPLYWRRRDDQWFQFTLQGEQPLQLDLPVAHISFFEADAFARWAGARLPTEAEWELGRRSVDGAASNETRQSGAWAATGDPLIDEFQRVWEWTASAYLPYPGFNPAPGAVGEYNGKFMINQMVLRGASSATPEGHERISYRNFFPAHIRWQYNGVRLAKNVNPPSSG